MTGPSQLSVPVSARPPGADDGIAVGAPFAATRIVWEKVDLIPLRTLVPSLTTATVSERRWDRMPGS